VQGRAAEVEACVTAGWLTVTQARVRLTPQGFLFADEVATRLWLD
jgi:coproporphyrinogen III oxidase-like Fe-S oxidoreductase